MDPIFKSAAVAVVPQPRQLPPLPFAVEDLQRTFVDITRAYPYAQFGLLPGDSGAQLSNGLEDTVLIQPGLIQVQALMGVPQAPTTEATREKCVSILRTATQRLQVPAFLSCAIKVVAHVQAGSGEDAAKAFLSERLLRGEELADELGAGFFSGGVKFRRIDPVAGREDNLAIEPYVQDFKMLFVEHNVGRAAVGQPFQEIGQVAEWLDEAFSFVNREAMSLLER